MKGNNGSKPNTSPIWHDQVLAEKDEQHRVYLCEYNLIHLSWGDHRLVYCPGDFMGLTFLLSALNKPCDMECTHGETCPGDHGDGVVHLQYGSVQIPFTRDECQELHIAVKEAVGRLFELRKDGYFLNQRFRRQCG
ncbi:MAG: hypothetical protein U9Q82_01785 [Chloroflexota bacterium]|nr:hypothetical protein [Chloroflexota bacterium]